MVLSILWRCCNCLSASRCNMSSHYVQLCTNPLNFEAVSNENSVFFDEANKQVFVVYRLNFKTHVVVKGPDAATKVMFDIPDTGHVHSIKFSYDHKILAIQRSPRTVDFINFADGIDSEQYHQTCKGKSAHVVGFNWTNLNEIVFITNQGLEFFQVMPEKHSLKMIKNYNVQVNWFVFLPESAMLLLSSSGYGNVIHPYHFRAGSVMRLPKFEVDLSAASKAQKVGLLERDVTLANMNQSRGPGGLPGAEIVLYQLQRDSPAKKTAVLQLNMIGRFAVNVVDNLVIVHHQASKTSMLFDIKLGGEFDGQVIHYQPVLAPLPIEQVSLEAEEKDQILGTVVKKNTACEMYSQNWIVFQPNIVIDARLGCLWEVMLKLEPLVTMIQDKGILIDFLLLRKDSKMVILAVFKQALIPGRQANLTVIAKMFDKVNSVYRAVLEAETLAIQATEVGRQPPPRPSPLPSNQTVVTQHDMYTHVLSMFVDNKDIKYKFMVAVLMEYIRSLNQYEISPEHYLYELVINLLVNNKRFYQFHQFLQYHVLSDSKHLACLMLSLEKAFPPAYQLALDMLKRLNTANEEIVEVLLSKHQILPALRYIRAIGIEDSASARKFLEAAAATNQAMLYYTVFKFFEQRNIRLRGSPDFAPGEHCDIYVKKFEEYFGAKTLVT
ncbi:regulator of MON1-CCZ1 complex isoform X2 [Nematostella vectensis]|uniref:regulator of MON1-CCZ1 complex isoform X2 n=1 Tax=Nematostella vectensis TaxID=45351 RepID=UPI0020776DE4|nr:regulator of MON1-CCZ1 complex isoform X2 [Nematostella vectensis]